jgi:serine/threonine protein kinase
MKTISLNSKALREMTVQKYAVGDMLLGQYTILAELGDDVFKVTDIYEKNSVYVLKIISHTSENLQAYTNALTVDLPNVVHTYFVREYKGKLYTLHDYIEGTVLETATQEQVLQLFKLVNSLHKEGYVHGDIKPKNCIVDNTGAVHLIDVGTLAKIGSQVQYPSGTTGFAPPELYELNTKMGIWIDIYELGCTLQEIYPQLADNIYQKATSKDKNLRYKSVSSFQTEYFRTVV